MSKPSIPYAEWRALVADGPAIVMMARADALQLLDHAERCETALRSAEVTPAMLSAALAVEPLTYAHQIEPGRALTAELRAENMRRCIEAALEARR